MEIFTAVPADARAEKRREYRHYLRERDGVPDLAAHTLSKREATMQRFLVAGARSIDMDVFERQCARFDPKCPTSPEELLLLALVKVNAAEAWGVDQTLDAAMARARRSEDDTEVMLLLEEFYHTKILLSSARLYGIDLVEASKPHVAVRALVKAIATLPEPFARILTLAGEIIGVIAFTNLLDVTRRVLRGAPVVRDAIEERLHEILIDEIGHVSFLRLCMSEVALTQTKRLLPLVAFGVARGVPEVAVLGAGPTAPLECVATLERRLPRAVATSAFFA
jgi:hypothetical protein